jgi:hypothetical protein
MIEQQIGEQMELNESHGQFINKVMTKIKESNEEAHRSFKPLPLVSTVCNGPEKGHQMTYNPN